MTLVITKMTLVITNMIPIDKNAFHKSENTSCNYELVSVHTIMLRTTKKYSNIFAWGYAFVGYEMKI